jgi:hypothetical protein
VVWWSELGGAARDVVDVVGARRSCSGRGWRGLWSTWSELGGATRDVVDVVGARRSRSAYEDVRSICFIHGGVTRSLHTWMHVYRQVLVACTAV